ncbi:MAG: metallophosphoesterase, partial [Slackia isoflavoniconvertens]|nr:metallophosphoesterase [Slackia isoflavoniconvertens]
VIVAGDFGFVWDGSNAEKYWLDWFESKPWTTCFVDGNHENHRMLAELPVREWNGGLVHEARPHVLHLMRGEVFDIAGATVLTMGGAASNDRQYRREGRSWWPEEMPSEEEMDHCRASLNRVGWRVDYVVSHEAPAALAEGLCRERGREYRGDRLQRFLAELDDRLGYRAWFFGHYHGDKWCDAKHRLIYRDIAPIESAAPGFQF